MPTISRTTTRGILVTVESQHVPERSRPDEGLWFFAYRVRIENTGGETVQLLSRHWIITDGDSHVEEVRGPGVIGEQPELSPGQSFEYVSACPLRTAFGTMHGSYQMITQEQESFDVRIAPFSLCGPNVVH